MTPLFFFYQSFKVFILNMPVYFPVGSSRYYKPLRKYKQRLLSPDERLERRLGNFPKVFPPLCLLHLCILRYTCPVCQGLEDVSLLEKKSSGLMSNSCQLSNCLLWWPCCSMLKQKEGGRMWGRRLLMY